MSGRRKEFELKFEHRTIQRNIQYQSRERYLAPEDSFWMKQPVVVSFELQFPLKAEGIHSKQHGQNLTARPCSFTL